MPAKLCPPTEIDVLFCLSGPNPCLLDPSPSTLMKAKGFSPFHNSLGFREIMTNIWLPPTSNITKLGSKRWGLRRCALSTEHLSVSTPTSGFSQPRHRHAVAEGSNDTRLRHMGPRAFDLSCLVASSVPLACASVVRDCNRPFAIKQQLLHRRRNHQLIFLACALVLFGFDSV